MPIETQQNLLLLLSFLVCFWFYLKKIDECFNITIIKNIYNTHIILVFHWPVWCLTLYPNATSFSLSIKIEQGFRMICDNNFDWLVFWLQVFASAIVLLRGNYICRYTIPWLI